jgi:hypothetical protein
MEMDKPYIKADKGSIAKKVLECNPQGGRRKARRMITW